MARQNHIGGVVRVEVMIRDDGTVLAGVGGQGASVLAPAAEEAIRKWRFTPAGKPVATAREVEITFALNQ